MLVFRRHNFQGIVLSLPNEELVALLDTHTLAPLFRESNDTAVLDSPLVTTVHELIDKFPTH